MLELVLVDVFRIERRQRRLGVDRIAFVDRDRVKDGTVTAFQLWSPYNEGWLAVHFAVGVLGKTVKNEVGATFEVPNLGTITINAGNSINTQSSLTTFDAKNIDEYKF